jgi:uncharacterized phage protein gp47/JayE
MSFTRPTLVELRDRAQSNLDSRLPGTDARLRRSNTNVLATVHSGAVHGLYGYLDYISRQAIPGPDNDEQWLERHASLYKVFRKAATSASGSITFTGNNDAVIPAGTSLQRSDGALYTTTAEATITAGTATAAISADVAGVAGNTAAGSQFSLVTPIDGVVMAATVAAGGLTNGTDIETLTRLWQRLERRLGQPPQGGADFDYVSWALEVPGVTRAWCYPNYLGLGTVGVTFVMDDQAGTIIPDAPKIAEVAAYIEQHEDPVTGVIIGRPVTADVTVFALTADPMDFTIDLTPDTAAIRTEVTAELADLIAREAEPAGKIFLTHIREAISTAAGEENHTLTVPNADQTAAAGTIFVMGAITWV